MPAEPRPKSAAFAALHGSAQTLHKVAAIDKAALRVFDRACLTMPPPLAPGQLKRLRESNQVSQPVVARYLNTSDMFLALERLQHDWKIVGVLLAAPALLYAEHLYQPQAARLDWAIPVRLKML